MSATRCPVTEVWTIGTTRYRLACVFAAGHPGDHGAEPVEITGEGEA